MRIRISVFILLVMIATVSPALSQDVKIKRWVIGSGGMLNASNGQNLKLSGQTGQVAIGKISGNVDGRQLDIYQGFWAPVDVVPTNVNDNETSVFSLVNYPNPFTNSTTIHLNVPAPGYLSLKIYDVTGNQVALLSDGYATTGDMDIKWLAKDKNGASLSSGTYICEMNFRPAIGFNFNKSNYLARILLILSK